MVRTGCVHYLFHFRSEESAFPTFFFKLMKMKKLESVGRVSLLRSHTGKSLCQDSSSDLCDCAFYRSGLCLFSESDLSSDWSDRALHPPAVLWHRGGSVTTPLQRHGMNISFHDYRHALLPGASWESCALSGWLASYWIRPSLDFSVGWPMLSFQLGRGDNPALAIPC